MGRAFDAGTMADALDRLAAHVAGRGEILDIAIDGGSALMLASNSAMPSEDVDARVIDRPWPDWLTEAAARVGRELELDEDWFNDGVLFHLSRQASIDADHLAFGTFPRGTADMGLRVFVPTAESMLALKRKAMRVLDPARGAQEAADIRHLMRVVGIEPAPTGDARCDALLAGAAESLARQQRLGEIPSWTRDPRRRLREPWFTTTSEDPGLREFLAHASPAEFRSRNIFTEERPFRRASDRGGARRATLD